MADNPNNEMPAYAGLRTVQKQGGSLMLAIPKRELVEVLEVCPEECKGKSVPLRLSSDGQLHADLSELEHGRAAD